ncbi:nucleotide-binding protein [Clostridia bacterium]|nr:nucleotide-binding protein [Clostridia bacterium]
MQLIIVTGMSGAGKSTVLKALEDYGFNCTDNLLPMFVPKLVEMETAEGNDNVALGIDIRSGSMLEALPEVVKSTRESGHSVSVLFLECGDEVLVKRYKETRRTHPLAKNDRVEVGIGKERVLLKDIKQCADYILDTNSFLTRQLKEKVIEIYFDNQKFTNLTITVLSFGFKYGIPSDSDLVFDVRFIENPFYEPKLRELTGLDPEVRGFVLSSEGSAEFLQKLNDMLEFLIPRYVKEGKNNLVVSIGCTGGKHRSVCLAREVYLNLTQKKQSVIISHRDIDKDSKGG